MRIGARPLAVLLAAGALAIPGACGGEEQSEGRPAARWMADVCTAIGSWVEDVDGRTRELNQASGNVATLEQGRDLFVDYMDDLVSRTDQAASDIAAAKQPEVERGAEITAELRKTISDIGDILAETSEAARELPVDDPARFQRRITALGASAGRRLGAAGKDFAAKLGGDTASELKDAFRDEPACEPLG